MVAESPESGRERVYLHIFFKKFCYFFEEYIVSYVRPLFCRRMNIDEFRREFFLHRAKQGNV